MAKLVVGGLLAACIVAGVTISHPQAEPRLRRALRWAAPGAIALSFLTLAGAALQGARFYWNPPRFAMSVALAHGYRLYYPSDAGPILNSLYPPVSVVAYLPTALAPTTYAATLMGAVIGGLFFFVPAIALIFLVAKRGEWIAPVYASAFFVMLCATSYPLRGAAFFQPVDPVALGFGAASCVTLFAYSRAASPSTRWLTLSALCVGLAIWSKQTLAPLGVALPLYLWFSRGLEHALKYLLRLVLAGAGLSALMVVLFGPFQDLFLNVWTIHSKHPFRSDTYPFMFWTTLAREAREWPTALAILVLALTLVWKLPNSAAGWRERWRRRLAAHPFLLPLWVSMWLMPTSYLGFMKEGGRSNSLGLHTYFMALAASLCLLGSAGCGVGANANADALTSWYRRWLPQSAIAMIGLSLVVYSLIDGPAYEPARSALLGVALLLFVLLLSVDSVASSLSSVVDRAGLLMAAAGVVYMGFGMTPFTLDQFHVSDSARRGPVIGAYKFVKRHPGEVFLPYDPLSTLLVDGKLYHFDYGLFDRRLAGFPIDEQQFRQYVPAQIKYVMYPRWVNQADCPRESLRYLTEFSQLVRLRGLEEWDVFMRPEDAKHELRSKR